MNSEKENFQIILRLCQKLLNSRDDKAIASTVNYAVKLLTSRLGGPLLNDDIHQAELIKRALVRSKRTEDAVRFDEFYGNLTKKTVLQHRPAAIQFLWALAQVDQSGEPTKPSPVFLSEALPQLSTNNNAVTSSLLADLLTTTTQNPPVTLPASSLSHRGFYRATDEIPEALLLRDLVFIFQGIDGKYIRFDPDNQVVVDPMAGVGEPIRDLIETRLGEVGQIYRYLKALTDTKLADQSLGLVAQCFYAGIQGGLSDFYRLLVVLEDQLGSTEGGSNVGAGLTLKRLIVWTYEPLHRLQVLAAIAKKCEGEKGGRIITAINSFSNYGDPAIRSMVKDILSRVSLPIFTMIQQWVYEGVLADPFSDFFVRVDPTVNDADEKLWTEKHTLDLTMIPVIIGSDLANKVLVTGKSLHFIRSMGGDYHDVVQPDVRKRHSKAYAYDNLPMLSDAIEYCYTVTSKRLLGILYSTHHFTSHLAAIRQYLLLGQGEMIQALMDLVQNDLDKPANTLYLHNLAGHLESAIRSTNAQFDEPHVLSCLDVRLFEASPNDIGWDVFSLDYKVGHPLNAIFTKNVRLQYLRMFSFLWRLKRLDQCLASIWRLNINNSKPLAGVPELSNVLHKCCLLRGQMLHFVYQMQYFLLFEVLECSWAALQTDLGKAEDLDQLIKAHNTFLNDILTKSLLGDSSTEIFKEMRLVGGIILKFNQSATVLYEAANIELNERRSLEDAIIARTKKGGWGMTAQDEVNERERKAQFERKVVRKVEEQMERIMKGWQERVSRFISLLSNQKNLNLRLLATRLNFNEYHMVQ